MIGLMIFNADGDNPLTTKLMSFKFKDEDKKSFDANVSLYGGNQEDVQKIIIDSFYSKDEISIRVSNRDAKCIDIKALVSGLTYNRPCSIGMFGASIDFTAHIK